MGIVTGITWCHHTFNGWWGCTRVSPGCENCYAEEWARRFGVGWGTQAARRLFGDKHWNEPLKWDRAARALGERRRVFCASMSDVFEDRRDLDRQRYRLWELINLTRGLDWLLLTKRPENVERFAPSDWWSRGFPANVWIGTTVEDKKRADERLPVLRTIPAAVRFVSFEPLLEDLGGVDLTGVDWGIVGGESGTGARAFDVDAAVSLFDRFELYGVTPFMKQLGARPKTTALVTVPYESDGVSAVAGGGAVRDVLWPIRTKKGDTLDEMPVALRRREFPVPRSQGTP